MARQQALDSGSVSKPAVLTPPAVILQGRMSHGRVLTLLTNRVGPMEMMFKCSADTKLTHRHT